MRSWWTRSRRRWPDGDRTASRYRVKVNILLRLSFAALLLLWITPRSILCAMSVVEVLRAISQPFSALFLLEMYLVVVISCLHYIRLLASTPMVSPLQWAVRKGKVADVKVFLDAGVDPNVGGVLFGLIPLPWSFIGPFGKSPLCDAAENVEVGWRLVKALIDAGIDPNVGGGTGPFGLVWSSSPLMYAIDNGEFAVVKMLLDAGADPNVGYTFGPFGWIVSLSPLEEAKDDSAMVKVLIDAGADPNVGATFGPFRLFASGSPLRRAKERVGESRRKHQR